jgi:hypothetical protein
MVCYSYDANYIRPIAMKSKSGAEWVRAFGIVFDEMTAKGFKHKLQTMDNEAWAALKNYFMEKNELSIIGPPALPQIKCYRAGNQNFQRAFQSRPRDSVSGLPHSLMGYTISPGRNHIKFVAIFNIVSSGSDSK